MSPETIEANYWLLQHALAQLYRMANQQKRAMLPGYGVTALRAIGAHRL